MGGYRPAICPLCCTVCPLFSHGATQVLINLSNLSAMCHDQGWPFYFILQGTFVSCESHSFEDFFTTDYQHLLDSSNFQTIVEIVIYLLIPILASCITFIEAMQHEQQDCLCSDPQCVKMTRVQFINYCSAQSDCPRPLAPAPTAQADKVQSQCHGAIFCWVP